MSWTAQEDQVLRSSFGRMPYAEMSPHVGNKTATSISIRALKLGLRRRTGRVGPKKRYKVNKRFFRVPSLQNAYWAGFLAADGCVSPESSVVKIDLHIRDREHLEQFAQDVGFDGPISEHSAGGFKPANRQARLSIAGIPEWVTDLRKNFRVTAAKSLSLKPPYLRSLRLRLAFIVGYLDGDGTIYTEMRRGTTVFGFRGTSEMLEWIRQQMDCLVPADRHPSCVSYCTKHPQYTVGGARALKILRILAALPTPHLRRKWPAHNYGRART